MLWRHILRFIASLAASGFTFLGLAVAALSFVFGGHGASVAFWMILGITILGALFWLLQASFEYKRKTNDPTWPLKYQEMWDQSTGWRNAAAAALLDHQTHLSDIDAHPELANIDEVLDILEDIGFYMMSDHITPETARHHFGYWIQGYWRAASPYIEAWRAKEPARWCHIKPLYDVVTAVGSGAEKSWAVDLPTFLEQEASVQPPS